MYLIVFLINIVTILIQRYSKVIKFNNKSFFNINIFWIQIIIEDKIISEISYNIGDRIYKIKLRWVSDCKWITWYVLLESKWMNQVGDSKLGWRMIFDKIETW